MIPQGPLFHKPKSAIAANGILYATILLVIPGYLIGEFSVGLPGLITTMVTIGLLMISVFLILVIILLHAALTLVPFFFRISLVLGFVFVLQTFLQIRALVFLYLVFSSHHQFLFDLAAVTSLSPGLPGKGPIPFASGE